MTIQKVLFHTQLRDMAFKSLQTLIPLKQAGLREIVLAYIIPRDEVAFVPYGGYDKESAIYIGEKARITLEAWQTSLAEAGIASHLRIESGAINATLLEIAKQENVDLIATGRKRRSVFEKVYVGTHIIDILRRSTVPVLMSKYMVEFEWDEETLTRVNDHVFKRPMLATDWSEPSANALDMIPAFKALIEKVLVVHVIGNKLAKGLNQSQLQALEQESEKRLGGYRQTLSQRQITAEIHLAVGKTVTEILRLSRAHDASLIVMGRTGKDWFQEYWLGGVSHRVAELSELPVLLVP
jgi:nucleotide-binding universal stress UspA family protein